MLVERGHQFIAYYNDERRLTVAGRKLGDKQWTKTNPAGVPSAHEHQSNTVGWDSHNYLRLALDRDGCLHVSGNMHVDPLVYYRTREPFDVATLERIDRMTGAREAHCTYPVFFHTAVGELLFRYRDGSSGNGSDIYNRYYEKTRSWQRVLTTPLLDGQGMRNAYALDPVLGPDGRFHLVWMWRESPDCSTNNTLSYARSRDFFHWETSDGAPLHLPITRSTGEVIDPAQAGEGLINMTFNLGFDSQNQPLVVYHRYDAQNHSQVYAARPRTTIGWERNQLSAWKFKWSFSGTGSIVGEVALGAPRLKPDGTISVDFSTKAAGGGRWKIDAATLGLIALLPSSQPALPAETLRSITVSKGHEIQTVVTRAEGRRYVLQWETLPRNRDLPRESIPPPATMRLYTFPDTEIDTSTHVGS